MLMRLLDRLIRPRPARVAGPDRAAALAAYAEAGTLLAAGRSEPALERLRDATRAWPEHAESHRLLGSVLGAIGRLDEAKVALERALALRPQHAGSLVDLANVYRLQGRNGDAEARYRQALALDNGDRAARLNLAMLQSETGRVAEALQALPALLEPPALPEAVKALIALLDREGCHAEAKGYCERVLAREPEHAAAHAALGFVLLKRELRPAQALVHFDAAIAVGEGEGDAETLSNRGIALQDLGRLDEAITAYDAALRADASHRVARFHRALACLMRGDFERGWPDYELRLASEDAAPPPWPFEVWDGEALPAGTLYVYGEQGIGDEVMFASCLPDAAQRCARVVLACSAKLEALLRRSFPAIEVMTLELARRTAVALPERERARMSAIGSLPRTLRRSIEAFPRHHGYLQADVQARRAWRARLDQLGPGLKVGLSWRGGTVRSRQALRTLGPAEIGALLDVPSVRFVNLQYDSDGKEVEMAAALSAGRLVHWGDALADYDATAALVSELDLVVSVCTAVIHLAGALGKPVWIMAPYSPEWRYGSAGEAMPWYPSARVIRQPRPGDWSDVIAIVVERLRALAA